MSVHTDEVSFSERDCGGVLHDVDQAVESAHLLGFRVILERQRLGEIGDWIGTPVDVTVT